MKKLFLNVLNFEFIWFTQSYNSNLHFSMSEGELLRKKTGQERVYDQYSSSIIGVYEPQRIDELKLEAKLRDIYAPLEYPACGGYELPNLGPIKDRKLEIGKKFAEEGLRSDNVQNSAFDGIYGFSNQTEINNNNMIREKIRIVRDVREQFFEENGQFIIEKDLFSEELSKLANISFENNDCIQYFQKNAILSQRNNQKKQTPYSMQLYVGGLWFNKHPLNNEQEKLFEEIRVLLKDWAHASLHPVLPEIAHEIEYLQKVRQIAQDTEQIDRKLELTKKKEIDEKLKLETLLKEIVHKNTELRDVRRRTGMDTVPWKVQIKQFEVDGKPSYDIGVTPFEMSQKVVAANAAQVQSEEKRRQQIREEVYFVRVYANNELVGKSQKVKLQWPSFRVPFFQKFTIMVYTVPATLKVEVVKSGFINQVIDTIYLAIPGVNAKALTSSQKRYAATTFAIDGRDYRKKMKEQKKGGQKVDSDAPSGILLHRIQWKGQGSKMPMLAPKTAEQQTACTQDTELDQASINEELFDAIDPRFPHKNLKERVQADIKKAGNALLPFADVQSARHLLLKMKNTMPQLEHIQIPLLEEEIRNRQDLLQIIQNQQEKRFQAFDTATQDIYNPLEGIFQDQPQIILKDIRQILNKIKILKAISSGTGGSNIRFKITEEIINQFIFEQQQSPIAVFFKNLFTQRRKLGPQQSQKSQTNPKIDELQINIHVRSAKNMPIRQVSYDRIKNFQDEQNKFKQQQLAQMNQVPAAIFDRFNGYGNGFFRQQPQINMHGNTFFNAFQNQGGRNQEVNYGNEHLQLDRANTFMELRFKKITKRTRCFQGPYPEWNETLFFNYSMKSQQTNPEKIMMNGQNPLKVFAFDMIQQSKPTQAIAQARVKKNKFYLGRYDIPFAFLMAVPTLSGLFKLDRPLIQFGYGIKRTGLFDADIDPQQMARTQNPDIHTYMNLDLFTEPMFDNMLAYNADRKAIQGKQTPQILQAATQWLEDLNTKRYVRMWFNNIEGKSVFICRYLSQNISPPKLIGEGGSGSMIERAARYVSLIPRKYNCKLLEGTEQFHMKCTQFLSVKMGDDHGILLCNYFNFIDRVEGRRDYESFLMICKAFPYGKCIFVLRRDMATKHAQIWDPYRGQCYYAPAKEYDTFCCFIKYEKTVENYDRAKDPCPIIEVSCIVSKDNIFYNLQEAIKPPNLDLDIQDEKLWKPFLTERSRNDLFARGAIDTIQDPIQEDFYPDLIKIQSQLQTQIYQFVRQKLQKQRITHFRPYSFKVNTRVSNLITKQLLQICQHFKVDHRLIGAQSSLYNERTRAVYEEVVAKLQEERDRIKTEIPPEKNLYGFTLNMTYTTLPQILEKITETQVHLDQNEDIEFVLGVRCFEYPGHLVSVWIFIGTIG